MDFQNIILIIVAFLDLCLAILVIKRKAKSESNISYTLFVFWAILWTIGIAMFRYVDNYSSLLFWNKRF